MFLKEAYLLPLSDQDNLSGKKSKKYHIQRIRRQRQLMAATRSGSAGKSNSLNEIS